MKFVLFLLLVLQFINGCQAQDSAILRDEFDNTGNGLMYADSTMRSLRHLVDSLNIRFKSCPAHSQYLSQPQAIMNTVVFSSTTNDLKEIQKDIRNGMNYTSLVEKYASLTDRKDTGRLYIRTIKNDPGGEADEEGNYYYSTGNPAEGYSADYSLNNARRVKTYGKWLISYTTKDKHNNSFELACRYIPGQWKQQPIPEEYSNYIAYVDCMIDTSTVIYMAEKTNTPPFSREKIAALEDLNNYLNRAMKIKRGKTEDRYEYDYFTEAKLSYANAHLKKDAAFNELVALAADACIEQNAGGNVFEELVADFISGKKALEIKRHRRVTGLCSMDNSPRIHARNIAILAATTNSWDIFLRAHLDIMNDRFDRMSDGSYAYGGRETYLHELELLNLDIIDLMLGLSLRASNTSGNHYNGTIWRLGRALAETSNANLFELKAIQIMKDNRLDDFNRGLIFMLYNSYLYYLKDAGLANQKIAELKKDQSAFPDFLSAAIMGMKARTGMEAY